MFDLGSSSTFTIIAAILVAIAVLVGLMGRNLRSPRKELFHLGIALVVVAAAGFFLMFEFPHTVYLTPVPEHISSLDEAQEIMRQQQEDLLKLSQSIQNFGASVRNFLWLGLFGVLPTVYKFARAVVTKEEIDHPAPGKPVLNLDDD
jgi:hypothetical protein